MVEVKAERREVKREGAGEVFGGLGEFGGFGRSGGGQRSRSRSRAWVEEGREIIVLDPPPGFGCGGGIRGGLE